MKTTRLMALEWLLFGTGFIVLGALASLGVWVSLAE